MYIVKIMCDVPGTTLLLLLEQLSDEVLTDMDMYRGYLALAFLCSKWKRWISQSALQPSSAVKGGNISRFRVNVVVTNNDTPHYRIWKSDTVSILLPMNCGNKSNLSIWIFPDKECMYVPLSTTYILLSVGVYMGGAGDAPGGGVYGGAGGVPDM